MDEKTEDGWEIGEDMETVTRKLVDEYGFEHDDGKFTMEVEKGHLNIELIERMGTDKKVSLNTGSPSLAQLEMAKMILDSAPRKLMGVDFMVKFDPHEGIRMKKKYSFKKYDMENIRSMIEDVGNKIGGLVAFSR